MNHASDANPDNVPNISESQKVGGAFYLPVTKGVAEAWQEVVKGLESLEDCDVNVSKELTDNFNAFGLQYYQDTYMLARTRFVKQDDEVFLELNKMEGDGFVFADHFKKNLVEKVGDCVKDIETAEPIAAESAKDSSLLYLELSNEVVATDLIKQWLTTLRPRAGVAYDQLQIRQTLCSLGWNSTNADNLKALEVYGDHIIGPVLEILRHEETKHVATAYFGALTLNSFVHGNAVPEELKTWESIFMLVEAMQKFCVDSQSAEEDEAKIQVTQSREVLRLFLSILEKLAPEVQGDQPAGMSEKVDEVLGALQDTLEEADLESLRNALKGGAAQEEEVNAVAK